MRIWDDLLTEQDRAVIEKAGYGKRGAASWVSRDIGERPACLIIDMQNLSLGANVPILQAIEQYPTAMGDIGWRCMAHMIPFLAEVRRVQVPIIYTRVMPRNVARDDVAVQIVESMKPQAQDVILDKAYASAFFGTALQDHLTQFNADTLIIIGNSTSGCVRATTVDARQHGYSVVIPEECVFDRIQASHKIALLDLWMKYAKVVSTEEVVAYLRNFKKIEG